MGGCAYYVNTLTGVPTRRHPKFPQDARSVGSTKSEYMARLEEKSKALVSKCSESVDHWKAKDSDYNGR